MSDQMVQREPLSVEEVCRDIDDVFTFNVPHSQDNLRKCGEIQSICKSFAKKIVLDVPEGKEQTICLNNLLAVALWAAHGITRRQVSLAIVPLPPESQNPT
jgi:hypothetical protein